MIQIPAFNATNADFEQDIDLDNITVTIRMTYNSRSSYWKVDFITENCSLLGIKCVRNYPLTQQHKAIFPCLPGDFLIQPLNDDLSGDY